MALPALPLEGSSAVGILAVKPNPTPFHQGKENILYKRLEGAKSEPQVAGNQD